MKDASLEGAKVEFSDLSDASLEGANFTNYIGDQIGTPASGTLQDCIDKWKSPPSFYLFP